MRPQKDPRKTLIFVFIAASLMIITDLVFFPMKVTTPSRDTSTDIEIENIYEHSESTDYQTGAIMQPHSEPKPFMSLNIDIPQPEPIKNNISKIITEPAQLKTDKQTPPEVAGPKQPAKPAARPKISGNGMVAIIIDDMGMDRKHSQQIMNLPAPITLAFLPYAPKLKEITEKAKADGHELLIHVPMQPLDRNLDPGPLELRDDMSEKSFNLALEQNFNSFEGYVGINNHMGSRLTQNRKYMDMVMDALAQRNLLFIDSVTIQSSVAASAAAEHGLKYNQRDVFLDHENNAAYVEQALYELEKIAKRRGYAIGIGHPKQVTIEGLKAWLPTLKDRGLTLVPVSRLASQSENIVVEIPTRPEAFGPLPMPAPQP